MKLPRPRRVALALLAGSVAFGCHAAAARSGQLLPNLALPTGGGNQLWADIAWSDGWRVQQHAWTGHARVLDRGDVRRAWGSEEACREVLMERAERRVGVSSEAPVAVLLHGLWRSRDSMGALREALEVEGYEVVDVAYPSTQDSIARHAERVAGVLDGIGGEGREVSFVTHSLGALVTRALLAREGDAWRARHELGRAVFIAAPQGGAALAEFGARIPGALSIYGVPSRELASGVADELPAPAIPFLNVAASRGTEEGWNPLVPGDDDGVVAVSETHLEGEAGHLLVEGVHTFVMEDEAVVGAACDFLRGGGL